MLPSVDVISMRLVALIAEYLMAAFFSNGYDS